MEKFISNNKSKVIWLACTAKGTRVNRSEWQFKHGVIATAGYKAARLVKGELDGKKGIFKILFSIEKTSLGVPKFSILAYNATVIDGKVIADSVPVKQASSLMITTAATKIINSLNIQTGKRWSGPKFFGLDRKDVNKLLTSSAIKEHHYLNKFICILKPKSFL